MATAESLSKALAMTPFRLSAEQFTEMARADYFGDHRVEMLGGRLFMMTPFPPHILGVIKVARALDRLFPEDSWSVREEKTLRLGPRWLPLPDVAVVRGRAEDFGHRLPVAADVALLVEVSDTTYPKDRGPKWRGYAATGVSVYWIVNLNARRVEVFSGPAGKGSKAAYRSEEFYALDDEVPVVIDGLEVGRIAVKDLLP